MSDTDSGSKCEEIYEIEKQMGIDLKDISANLKLISSILSGMYVDKEELKKGFYKGSE